MKRPFELTDLINPSRLESWAEDISNFIGMSSGIVAMPISEQLEVINKYKEYLDDVKPDVSILRIMEDNLPSPEGNRVTCVYNQSEFCKIIRKSKLGI